MKKTTKTRLGQPVRARKKRQRTLETQGMAPQMALPFPTEAARPCASHLSVSTLAAKPNTEAFTLGGRLRVVRELDSAISPCCAGRMVISGRIADVCAELERLSHT